MMKISIRKNDTVEVIAGSDKGKKGRVLEVDRDNGRLLVEHIRMVKKHVRPNPQKQIKGGIAERESSIAISNVLVVCPHCGASSRMSIRIDGGERSRWCRKCDNAIENK